MQTPGDDIHVEISFEGNPDEFDCERFAELSTGICRRFLSVRATVSVSIVGDEGIKDVNLNYLGKSALTDVISFDLSDEVEESKVFEVVVNADEARRQSQRRDHSVEAEIALYITHGLLHNLGFDDASKQQAEEMHRMEDEILQQAGFGTVFGRVEKQ